MFLKANTYIVSTIRTTLLIQVSIILCNYNIGRSVAGGEYKPPPITKFLATALGIGINIGVYFKLNKSKMYI